MGLLDRNTHHLLPQVPLIEKDLTMPYQSLHYWFFFRHDYRDILDAVIIVTVTAIALSVIIHVIFLLLNYGIPYELLRALSELLLFDS